MKELFQGIFQKDKKIITLHDSQERVWDPNHSKAAAAIAKGIKNFPIKEGTKLLYLGIADGTTASHLSDIIGSDGIILGIDIAPKPFQKLLKLCETRENIIPVLSDANHTENYSDYAEEIGKFDVIYQDLSQKIQADIIIKNAKEFLKKDGTIVYMVKSLSIDVTEKPSVTFAQEIVKLENAGFEIIEKVSLEPFQGGHACLVAKYRK